MTPACFDSQEQWDAWREAARLAPPNRWNGYCEDCTPTYQRQMRLEGRCQYAYTVFRIIRVGDGLDITGIRDREQR